MLSNYLINEGIIRMVNLIKRRILEFEYLWIIKDCLNKIAQLDIKLVNVLHSSKSITICIIRESKSVISMILGIVHYKTVKQSYILLEI